MKKTTNIFTSSLITGAVIAATGLGAGAQPTDAIRSFHVNVSRPKLAIQLLTVGYKVLVVCTTRTLCFLPFPADVIAGGYFYNGKLVNQLLQ